MGKSFLPFTHRSMLAATTAVMSCIVAQAAMAQTQSRTFDVPAGRATDTLPIFAKQAGAQIIGNAKQLKGKRTRAVKGTYTLQEAMRILLQDSGLGQQATDGDIITIGLAMRNSQTATTGQSATDSEAIADILVIGSRSRNVDIRRTKNDSQPYVTFDRKEIESSQATTVEEFLRSRLTQNSGAGGSQSQAVAGTGSTVSSFNLRGLGTNQTLILVNGRRLPVLNNRTSAPRQADINGIPIGSIERIEVLPSSAGGIYGGNAVGGVINIILRSDYRGVDVTLTYNDTDDFKAPNGRIDVNGGFSLEGGKTTVTFGGSYSKSGTLRMEDRIDTVRRGVELYRSHVNIYSGTGVPPVGNGVNIRSATGAVLTLKPQYGGTSLNSTITNLPLGYAGVASDNGALLVANAGTFNLAPPDDVSGLQRGLVTSPAVASGNVSVRRKFTSWLDLFVDYSHLENKGTTYAATQVTNNVLLAATAPTNPFQQSIRVTYPTPGVSLPYRTTSNTDTLSVGGIVRLPFKWAVNVEYNKTWSDTTIKSYSKAFPDAVNTCISSGSATCLGSAGINPLQTPIDFTPYLYPDYTQLVGPTSSTFSNPVLRASGPLFKIWGGNASMTLAVQRETTGIDASTSVITDGTASGHYYTTYAPRKQSTTSEYGEIVLPLASPENGVPFLRELELRGAVRHDAYYTQSAPAGTALINYLSGGTPITQITGYEVVSSSDPTTPYPSYTPVESRFSSTNFTFAGRYSPFKGITFRASYATGFLPPSVVQLSGQTLTNPFGLGVPDPFRGNEIVSYPITQTQGGGNTRLDPETSKTLSFGVILTPVRDLRFSADYTRIRKKGEIGSVPTAFLLANPDLFPGRVVRGPASDGYSVGRIISVDLTPINLLSSQVQAIDFQAEYTLRLNKLGEIRFYGLATWQPDTVRQIIITAPALNYTGNADGPLEWQGNAGFDWTLGKASLRWNTQYYDAYNVYSTNDAASTKASRILWQGSSRIPSQTYSDIYFSYDFGSARGALHGVKLSAGIQNLFNSRPPVVAVSSYLSGTYSYYGDIRLRRFTLSLRKSFGPTN